MPAPPRSVADHVRFACVGVVLATDARATPDRRARRSFAAVGAERSTTTVMPMSALGPQLDTPSITVPAFNANLTVPGPPPVSLPMEQPLAVPLRTMSRASSHLTLPPNWIENLRLPERVGEPGMLLK